MYEKTRRKYPDAIYIPLDKMDLFDTIIETNVSISTVFYNAEPIFHHSAGDPRLDDDRYNVE